MRNLFRHNFLLVSILILGAHIPCFAQPAIEFDTLQQTLGNIPTGGPVQQLSYLFTNSGNQPLLITNVVAGCGCTVAQYPKDSIFPGKTGQVILKYTPGPTAGPVMKIVNVHTNGIPEITTIVLRANQVKPTKLIEVPGPAATYTQRFPYNEKTIVLQDPKFVAFINTAESNLKRGGHLVFTIESSCSTVPTKTFKTNQALADKRAQEAKTKILQLMSDHGHPNTSYRFSPLKSIVQGPVYNNDAVENEDIYEAYQYVKVIASYIPKMP